MAFYALRQNVTLRVAFEVVGKWMKKVIYDVSISRHPRYYSRQIATEININWVVYFDREVKEEDGNL